jgi:hypothetical protein
VGRIGAKQLFIAPANNGRYREGMKWKLPIATALLTVFAVSAARGQEEAGRYDAKGFRQEKQSSGSAEAPPTDTYRTIREWRHAATTGGFKEQRAAAETLYRIADPFTQRKQRLSPEEARLLQAAAAAFLEDGDHLLRARGLMILDRCGSPDFLPLVSQTLLSDGVLMVRSRAIQVLNKRKLPGSVPTLKTALMNEEEHMAIRTRAVEGLEAIGNEEAMDALNAARQSVSDRKLREQIYKALLPRSKDD